MPLTLAFDAAAGRCAVALFDGGILLDERAEVMEHGHAERLFPMIEESLAAAGRGWREISLIAVGVGPGNFTGARIAVAAARGLALSTGARAVGVDRFEALAEGVPGPVCAALIGRGGALHLARFENGGSTCEAMTLPAAEGGAFARGALVVGDGAAALIAATGEGRPGPELAETPLSALSRVAARKAALGAPRPAPRYLQPAGAAPMRPAPTILR
ncbi:MAG: tRNA (adenosine(37)-N6)-threonylcarbamoyltransferase complex dimerization subunit type 1 TsaB [Paracoccaceae bacterium]